MARVITPLFGGTPAVSRGTPCDVFTFEAGIAFLHEIYARRHTDNFILNGNEASLDLARAHLFAASAARQLAGAVPAFVPDPVRGIGITVYGCQRVPGAVRAAVAEAFPGRRLFLCGSDNSRFVYNCLMIPAEPGENVRPQLRRLKLVARRMAGVTALAITVSEYCAVLRTVATKECRLDDGLPVALDIAPFAKFIAFRRGRGYSPQTTAIRWERRRMARLRAAMAVDPVSMDEP